MSLKPKVVGEVVGRKLARHSSDCTHKFFGVSNGSAEAHSKQNGHGASGQKKQRSVSGDSVTSDEKLVAGKIGVRKDKRLQSKTCNGLTYNQVPQNSSTSLNNNDDKASTPAPMSAAHKAALRIGARGANLLGLPRVKRSQSFSPRYDTPSDAVVRSHSDRKNMDGSASRAGRRPANGAVTSQHYQNVPQHDTKLANGDVSSNGHATYLATHDLDDSKESVL